MNIINIKMNKNLGCGRQARTSPVEAGAKYSGSFGGFDKFSLSDSFL